MTAQEFSLPKRQLAGIPLVQCDLNQAAAELCRMAKERSGVRGHSIHLVNAYTISLTHSNRAYLDLVSSSTANFPDGKPLTWWKLDGVSRLQQIRGPRLFEEVVSLGRSSGVRHFLLGSSEDTLQLIEASLKKRYPGANIVGSFSPPFRQMTSDELEHQDDIIRKSGAEVVWVGLGTPKQDWEVARLARRVPAVCVAVGAAFDFTAGTKREAPAWMSSLSLEWLFRFLSEPRRLWRRYLIGNLMFLLAVAKHTRRQQKVNPRIDAK